MICNIFWNLVCDSVVPIPIFVCLFLRSLVPVDKIFPLQWAFSLCCRDVLTRYLVWFRKSMNFIRSRKSKCQIRNSATSQLYAAVVNHFDRIACNSRYESNMKFKRFTFQIYVQQLRNLLHTFFDSTSSGYYDPTNDIRYIIFSFGQPN